MAYERIFTGFIDLILRKLLFPAIFILPACLVYAQQKPESETRVSRLLSETETLSKTQPDSAYILLQDLLQKKLSRIDEARSHQQMGRILFNYSNYTQALEHLLVAEKIYREEEEQSLLAENLNDLGRVYHSNKQIDLANRQFREALQINLELKNQEGLAQSYGNIGHIYEKRLSPDSALYFQNAALAILKTINKERESAKIYENLGSIYEDLARYDSARYCFERALSINQKYGDEISQIEVLNNLGDIERKTGNYLNGIKFTRRALDLALKTQSQYQMGSAYRDLARGYEFLGQYDSAYFNNEKARSLVEEIYSATNNRQTALLETIYEVEKKNNQISKLALDKKLNTILSIAGGIVVLLLAGLGALVINRQRMKIRNEKALNERNTHIYETNRELMQAELRNKLLEEEKLRSTLESRGKELSTHTLHLIQKNQLLDELRTQLIEIAQDEKRDQKRQIKQLAQKINMNFVQDAYWDDFRAIFDQVHQTFFFNLKQRAGNLTPAEMKLVALLKMNLPSTDIATLLGISQDSLRVARYRLKKKLNIGEGESLTSFLQEL